MFIVRVCLKTCISGPWIPNFFWSRRPNACSQGSAAKKMITALFRVITQRIVVISYRSLGTTYPPPPPTPEDEAVRLSQNVGKKPKVIILQGYSSHSTTVLSGYITYQHHLHVCDTQPPPRARKYSTTGPNTGPGLPHPTPPVTPGA